MRSPQTLLVPLLALASAGFLMPNAAARGRIAAATARSADAANATKPGAHPGRHVEHIRHMLQMSRITGLAVLTAGVICFHLLRSPQLGLPRTGDTASDRPRRRDHCLRGPSACQENFMTMPDLGARTARNWPVFPPSRTLIR
jgi:hypothetical protein